VKAVNVFQVDSSKQNNIQHIFKSNLQEFNILYSKNQVEVKNEYAEAEMVPLKTAYDFHALDIIKVLKKSTMVKR
jgi:hypothetical protein